MCEHGCRTKQSELAMIGLCNMSVRRLTASTLSQSAIVYMVLHFFRQHEAFHKFMLVTYLITPSITATIEMFFGFHRPPIKSTPGLKSKKKSAGTKPSQIKSKPSHKVTAKYYQPEDRAVFRYLDPNQEVVQSVKVPANASLPKFTIPNYGMQLEKMWKVADAQKEEELVSPSNDRDRKCVFGRRVPSLVAEADAIRQLAGRLAPKVVEKDVGKKKRSSISDEDAAESRQAWRGLKEELAVQKERVRTMQIRAEERELARVELRRHRDEARREHEQSAPHVLNQHHDHYCRHRHQYSHAPRRCHYQQQPASPHHNHQHHQPLSPSPYHHPSPAERAYSSTSHDDHYHERERRRSSVISIANQVAKRVLQRLREIERHTTRQRRSSWSKLREEAKDADMERKLEERILERLLNGNGLGRRHSYVRI